MKVCKLKKIAIGALLTAIVAATATAFSIQSRVNNKWSEIDAFKTKLLVNYGDEGVDSNTFNISRLAEELGKLRIDGMAVCASDEISADQYIQLASISNALSKHPHVKVQLKVLLSGDRGLSDCQYRVLDFATANRDA